MVPTLTLWLPVLLSAVVVFVVSSVLHMVLPFHRGDLQKLPKEDEMMEALRKFAIPPGDYGMPMPGSMAGMKSPEFIDKMKRGPVAFITVRPSGPPAMGKSLVQWFLLGLFVSFYTAYITGRALGPGAPYLAVFRFAGAAAFAAYGIALVQQSIWSGRRWSTTWKGVLDGFIYACATAAVFGWLWPS